MFRFRGKRKDNGEWVVGCYCEKYSRACIYNKKDGFWYEIHQDSLSISTGKPDSKKEEIFASFPIDGVMTEGGDVVEVGGEHYSVLYLSDTAQFCISGESGVVCPFADLYSQNLTIIGKQGGGNDRRLNIMAQIGMERTDLHT